MGIRVYSGGGGFSGGTLTSALLFSADNTIDIGAAGATRPRTGYFGTSVISPVLDSGAATNLLLKYNGTTAVTISGGSGGTATVVGGLNWGGALSGQAENSSLLTFNWDVRAKTSTTANLDFLSGAVITNEGATGAASGRIVTMNGAAAGKTYTFVIQDVDGQRIAAATGDTIRVIDKVTAAAGYIESTTIGSTVTLVAINATEWIATSINGTWTDGTFTFDNTSLTTP